MADLCREMARMSQGDRAVMAAAARLVLACGRHGMSAQATLDMLRQLRAACAADLGWLVAASVDTALPAAAAALQAAAAASPRAAGSQ